MMEKLGGSWKLVYTSNSELIALLALGRLPLVTVGDITQTIDTSTMSVENQVRGARARANKRERGLGSFLASASSKRRE